LNAQQLLKLSVCLVLNLTDTDYPCCWSFVKLQDEWKICCGFFPPAN